LSNGVFLRAADVVTQRRGFEFDLLYATFHYVADRDDADQLTVLHDGQMPALASATEFHSAESFKLVETLKLSK